MKLNVLGLQPIYLPHDPVLPNEAATKQYVDNSVYAHAANVDVHLTTAQNSFLDSVTITAVEINHLSGISGNVQTQLDSKLALSGGTMLGSLTLVGDPSAALHAATKQYVDAADAALDGRVDTLEVTVAGLAADPVTKTYVDSQDATKVAKAGDTMTGLLTLSGNPTANLHAATKQYVDTADAALNVRLTNAENSITTLELDPVTKTYVDNADATKVAKSGSTMTGALILSGDPTASLQAVTKQYTDAADSALDTRLTTAEGTIATLNTDPVTKQYVDTADATKVAKSGDTMTGFLTLSADPSASLHAATKQYVDSGIATHASDATIHITADQNSFLDAITVTATEVNRLSGVSGNVQTQLDSKLALAGGSMTGSIDMATGTFISLNSLPTNNVHAVNKAYVDNLINGLKWKDPIVDSNLVGFGLDTPPVTPVEGHSYVVGSAPTGAWSTHAGRLVTYVNSAWVDILGRALVVGDRIGVGFESELADLDASVSAADNKLISISSVSPLQFTTVTNAVSDTTLVTDSDSFYFGNSYTYADTNNWIKVSSPISFITGTGLSLVGKTLSVNIGAGLTSFDDSGVSRIKINLYANTGLYFTEDGSTVSSSNAASLALKLDPTTLVVSGGAVAVAPAVMTDLAGKVNKAGDTMTGALTLSGAPTANLHAVTKAYVDAADTALDGRVDTLEATVAILDADAVTKTYVDAADATKVAKAGDTMTGLLTLSSNPTSALHAATKQYVDSADSVLDGRVTTLEDTVAVLDADAVTKTYVDAADATKVAKAGSTMTGALILSADPTANLQAATKQYVDTGDAALNVRLTSAEATIATLDADAVTKTYVDAADATKVAKAGDTMTGLLTLSGNPSANLHAATKQYVDAADSALDTRLTAAEGTIATLDADAVTKTYVDSQDATKVAKAGDVMTGHLTLSADPTVALHAVTKQYVDTADTALDGRVTTLESSVSGLTSDAVTKTYVDNQDATKVAKAGDTMTGHLTLSGAPTAGLHAATKTYVDSGISTHASDDSIHITSAQNSLLDGIIVSFGDINYLSGITGNVQDQIDTKVAKAGDTLTGYLSLHANPTNPLHAATKQYVDSADNVIQAQVTTLQGTVSTLNVDPVTKSYVDNNLANKVDKTGDSMSGYLTLVGAPTNPLHAATKQYVDNVAQGLKSKPSVRYATTAALNATYNNGTSGVNATLVGNVNGPLVLGGFTTIVNDRILVKDEANQAWFGAYVVQQVGDALTPFILKRVETIDESSEVPGSYFYVYDGVLKGTGWTLTVANPDTFTIGTDAITANQFTGAGAYVAGNGMTASGTTFHVGTASTARIVVNADNIDLAFTGVIAGTYKSVDVDAYGRITGGSNPTTLAGYGIVDAQGLNASLTAISGLTTYGIVVRTDDTTATTKSLSVAGIGLSIANADGIGAGNIAITSNATPNNTPETLVSRDASGNFTAGTITATLNGNAATATKLAATKNFSATGDVTAAAVAFDGSGNVELDIQINNSGVAPGTYKSVTVGADGRVTDGTNPTTLAGYGITDGASITYVDDKIAELEAKVLELTNYIMARMS